MDREVPGHVFVVRTDVTTLNADAWLCPTDGFFHVTAGFGEPLGLPQGGFLSGYHWDDDECVTPFKSADKDGPLVVLGLVGRPTPRTPEALRQCIEELSPVVDAFVRLAAERCRGRRQNRPPRFALPLLGTGYGGLRGAKGDVIRPLLTQLSRCAAEHRVDLILCVDNELAWSAVQSARVGDDWGLNADEEDLAQRLSAEARAKRLVLFIGAGASRDAGLPDWKTLLTRLYPSEFPGEQSTLKDLDPRDHATLIEHRLGGRKHLLERLTEEIGRYRRIGLTHALLASLGAEQAVTTNYDNLYERACTRRGHTVEDDLTVLPYGRVAENRPWLLKLHGSLDHIERRDHIVLTRSDYMTMARERSALFGIVQALLVTKHLLFVGYSLSDEDFHQLVEEIRIAIEPSDSERILGTVLMTGNWPLAGLWGDVLRVQPIGDAHALRNRHLQVFLDRVAHLATPHDSYLLDDSFTELLDPDERRIAGRLVELQQLVDDVLRARPDHGTAAAVRRALERFGAPQRES